MSESTTHTDKLKLNQNALVKLERNQSSIFKHLTKLNSYTCEPTDYSCFLQIRKLKEDFAELAFDHKDLFDDIRNNSVINSKDLKRIRDFEFRFRELERELGKYLSKTNNHY